MIGNFELAYGVVKATEEIGSHFNPNINYVNLSKKNPSVASMEDLFLKDISKSTNLLKKSIPSIKSYSSKKASKSLKDLYVYEDILDILVTDMKKIEPASNSEKLLIEEFIKFTDCFYGIIGLLETMTLPVKERNRIFSYSKKASRGSRKLTAEDLLD